MSETKLYADILREYSRGTSRLFRFNAGMAYQGRVLERSADRLVLGPWYPIRMAPEGFSDLAGWTTIDGMAVFTAIEGKYGKRKTTPEQDAFIATVLRAGGRAGVARSVEDAGRIICP
jgi:hypothetical protein